MSPNRIVTLTSDSLPVPYGCAASNEGSGPAWQAFDTADSQWIANATSGWIYYNFGSAKWAANGYSIEPQSTTRICKTWTFEGSNDASSWTTLDTQTNQTTWTTGVKVFYSFSNSALYRYYRLNISANNGDGSNLEIDEIQIFAPDSGILGGEI